ncbi:MAG: hypothetical protein ACRBN8_36430 [Nannocystales bacterium]
MQKSPHPYRGPSEEPVACFGFQQQRPFPVSLLFGAVMALMGVVLIGATGHRMFGLLIVVGVASGVSQWKRWRVGRFGRRRGRVEVFADEATLVGVNVAPIGGARLIDGGQTLQMMTRGGRELHLEARDFHSPEEFAECVKECLRVAKVVELRLPPGVSADERDAFLRTLEQEAGRPSPAELEARWDEFLSEHPAAVEHDAYEQRLQHDLDSQDS